MKELWRGFVVLIFLVVLTGVVYPLLLTGIGHIAFPDKATGSVVRIDGKLMGSELIGQEFASPGYFWSRPSATLPPYNPQASRAADLGPTNPKLLTAIAKRVKHLEHADPRQKHMLIPVDLVTSSASGLDPHISLLSAEYQAPRVAKARRMKLKDVKAIIKKYTIYPQFSFMGQARVNVLELNLALDDQFK